MTKRSFKKVAAIAVGLVAGCVWLPGLADEVKVSVNGVSGELRDNVRVLLGINNLGKSPSEQAIRRAHKRAQREITQALQPFGFYTPRIEALLLPQDDSPGHWRATYTITPGKPVRYRNIDIVVHEPGNAIAGVQAMLAKPVFVAGEVLSHQQYDRFKNELMDAAYREGYLDARFTQAEMRVLPEQAAVDVAWRFDPGQQSYFGAVQVQQDVLRADFVDRLVRIDAGEPFQPQRLVAARLALTDSQYFSGVDISVHREQTQDQRIPVTIQATPSPARKYTAYVGFGTDTGPRLGVGTEFRRINRAGHQLSFDARLSAVKSNLSAEYGIPIGDVKTDRLSFFASVEQAEVGDADADQFAVGARIEDNWLGLRRQVYLIFSRENFAFGDQSSESATLLTPGMALSWQKVDDPLFTRRGFAAALDVHGGETNVLSDTTFMHAKLTTSAVLPLGSRARLLLRGELGGIWADDFSALPPSQRFFTGGDRSVRGYAYEGLSPQNDFGDDIGGRFLNVVSAEVDVLLHGPYGMAVFYDLGGVANQVGEDLHAGVGIGFRYKSPVGMIRVDLAHPLDDPDTSFRLHLTFGPDL